MTQRSSKLTFFYPPTIDWGWMFQRPHHLATVLAGMGHRFFFCQKTQLGDASGVRDVHEIMDNLFLVSKDWEGVLKELKPEVLLISWAFHHTAADISPDSLVVYDCLDDFPEWRSYEDKMAGKADVVLATSRWNAMRWMIRSDYGGPVVMVPNAAPGSWIGRPAASVFLNSDRRKVLFCGYVGPWVDGRLMTDVAKRLSELDVEMVVVGPFHDPDVMSSMRDAGATIIGTVGYCRVMEIMSSCDVGLIPFVVGSQVTNGADPIKAYEYVAAGLPVVSTRIPEMNKFEDKGLAVLVPNDAGKMTEAIMKVMDIRNDAGELEKRRKFAMRNTWKARANRIIKAIEMVSAS